MSLDNGTYIIKLRAENGNEFYVKQVHCVSQIFKNTSALHDVIVTSKKTATLSEAIDVADTLEKEARSENGVLLVTDFDDHTSDQIKKLANQHAVHSLLQT